jgi:hypothetical protein
MGGFFTSLKSFFESINISKSCLSDCCIRETIIENHNETIICHEIPKHQKHRHKHHKKEEESINKDKENNIEILG